MAGQSPDDLSARKHDKKRSHVDMGDNERSRKFHKTGSHCSNALDGDISTRQTGDAADLGKRRKGHPAQGGSKQSAAESSPSEDKKRRHRNEKDSTKERSNTNTESKGNAEGEEGPGVYQSSSNSRKAPHFCGEEKLDQDHTLSVARGGDEAGSRSFDKKLYTQSKEGATKERTSKETSNIPTAGRIDIRSTVDGKKRPSPTTNTDSHSKQPSPLASSIDRSTRDQTAASGRPAVPSPFWDEFWENNQSIAKHSNQGRVDGSPAAGHNIEPNSSALSKDKVPSYDDFKPIRNTSNAGKSKHNAKARSTAKPQDTNKLQDVVPVGTVSNSESKTVPSGLGNAYVPDIETLDAKYPSATAYPDVPGYEHARPLPPHRKLDQQRDPTRPPPLPPIDEKFMLPVFTHASFVDSKYGSTALETYDRLELLGDAYIEIIATRMLYSRLPNRLVGKLSRLREELVSNNSLAVFSAIYGFDKRIRPDLTGLLQKQKLQKQKVLGDVFEAYVAAIVESNKEHGFANAEEWLTELWAPILLEKAPDAVAENTKALLQQKLDGHQIRIQYREYRSPQHLGHGETRFFHEVALTGWGYNDKLLGTGWGNSKTIAQMNAAKDALENKDLLDEICENKRVQEEKRKAERAGQKSELQGAGQDAKREKVAATGAA